MKLTYGARLLAALAVVVSVQAGPVTAAERIRDKAAWAHLQEMEKRGVTRDPFWAQAFLAQSRFAPGDSSRVADLRWALRFDRDLGAARWALAGSFLKKRDPEFANQILLIGQRALQSFLAQQRALVWAATIGGVALLGAFVLWALVAIGRTTGVIYHGVWERLIFLPNELRRGGAVLTLIVPITLAITLPATASVLWLLLLGTVGAWTFLRRNERRTCVTAIVLVLLAPLGLGLWTRISELSRPDSYLRTLWSAQSSWVHVEQIRAASPPDAALADAGYNASLALIERRAGRYEDAAVYLDRAIRLAPDDWAYYNNLGNVRLLAGDVEGALGMYARATAIAPNEALVRVNEAQAWMRKLRFTRAEQALNEAARLGYRIPRLLSAGATDIIVRDRVLDVTQVWMRFAKGARVGTELSWKDAALMTLAPVFPLRPFWLSAALFLALHLVSRSRSLPQGHTCAGCGRLICRKCHYRVLRRSLCTACNAIRLDVRAPLKREALLRERRISVMRWPRFAGILVSLLIPGTGQMLAGAPKRAWWILAASFALVFVAGAGVLWPDPGGAAVRDGFRWLVWIPVGVYAAISIGSVRAYVASTARALAVGLSRPGSI